MITYIQTVDERILMFIQEHLRNDFLTPIFRLFTALGDAGAIWILIILVLFLIKPYRKKALVALISLAVCFALNDLILKIMVARARPFDVMSNLQVLIERPVDFSFPSGHSASSFVVASAIFFMGNRKLGAAAFVLAFIIACSRLYLGVHYPSDVLAGSLLGLTVGFVMVWLMKDRVNQKSQ